MSGYDAMDGITGNADADAASDLMCVQRFERGSVPLLMGESVVSGRASPLACSATPLAISLGGVEGFIAVLQVACVGTAGCLA